MLLFMSDVTQILSAIEQGDPSAAQQLMPLVYDELRKLAAVKLAQEKPGQTLQATALVHEAYLRLVESSPRPSGGEGPGVGGVRWDSRGHFFAAAAEAMRRILVESARRRRSEKRGGRARRIDFETVQTLAEPPADDQADDLLALDEALDLLAKEDPDKAELVKLRCFAGLSHQDAAEALGVSRATADRYWAYAKSWLYCRLHESDSENPG
jgi:RNA polymerase sigma factor (TIGR02999 family)